MKTKLIPITSLDQLQVGDLIQERKEAPRKILDKTANLVALSFRDKLEEYCGFETLYSLIEDGDHLQVTDEPWKPKEGEMYFFPLITGGKPEAISTYFAVLKKSDQGRLAAGMCFQTEAEALAAAQKMLDAIKPNQL